jgi:hypothetical protein
MQGLNPSLFTYALKLKLRNSATLSPTTLTYRYMSVFRYILLSRYIHLKTSSNSGRSNTGSHEFT